MLTQLLEPVGSFQHGADGHLFDLDLALRALGLPAAHDDHDPTVADCAEDTLVQQCGVVEAVNAIGRSLAYRAHEPLTPWHDDIGAKATHERLVLRLGVSPTMTERLTTADRGAFVFVLAATRIKRLQAVHARVNVSY